MAPQGFMYLRRTMYRWQASNVTSMFIPAVLCFLVVNITNTTILNWAANHGLIHGTAAKLATNYQLKSQYYLVPIKTVIFTLAAGLLIVPVYRSCLANMSKVLDRRDIRRTLKSLSLCLLLTASLSPMSSGKFYAMRSTDPFNQNTDQLYRRLLVPAIAHFLQLDGVFYIWIFWAIVISSGLLVAAYSKLQGISLTRVQEVSFYSSGIFVCAYQVPGYPDIAVFLLALVALLDRQSTQRHTRVQTAAFALALMAHEAGAVIVFLPLALFILGRRSWLPYGILCALYAATLLANFRFSPSAVFHAQTMVGEMSAHDYFWLSPLRVVWAALLAFKLLWLFVPIGIYLQYRTDPAYVGFIVSGFALALASTYIAVDYSRLVALATIPMLVCLTQARKHLSTRTLDILSAGNLLIPSFYLGGNTGIVPFAGLYYMVYRHLWHLPSPGIH